MIKIRISTGDFIKEFGYKLDWKRLRSRCILFPVSLYKSSLILDLSLNQLLLLVQ